MNVANEDGYATVRFETEKRIGRDVCEMTSVIVWRPRAGSIGACVPIRPVYKTTRTGRARDFRRSVKKNQWRQARN